MDWTKFLNKIDVVEELEKRGVTGLITGKSLRVPCVFHAENAPSLNIDVSEGDFRGVFHCFGCGEKGSFFKLLAKLDEKTDKQVIKEFLVRFNDVSLNIDVDDIVSKWQELKSSKKGVIRVLNKEMMSDFKPLSGKFVNYLKNRGIKKTIALN
jgi:DNA primase